MTTKRLALGSLSCLAIAVGGACTQKGMGYGDPNSIIVVMAEDDWYDVSDDVYAALERRIATVRDEKTFTVTYQEPFDRHWLNLRRFRQMLVIGSRADAWVQEVLEEARTPITQDGVHQVYDVWATGQTVTLLLLPDGWEPADVQGYLGGIHDLLDGQYRAYARNRMYMSGVDSTLADSLSTEQGFAIYLPDVYRWRQIDSVLVFRNDNPDPSELIREIVVTWMSPASTRLSREEVLRWRASLVAEHYAEPQDVVLDDVIEEALDFHGNTALQVQAQWRNPPDRGWPAGGPFITRAITCDSQDRTYLVDAWLHAPGKEKYEYMIQLETILETFRCAT
jgi:hypothetical protein